MPQSPQRRSRCICCSNNARCQQQLPTHLRAVKARWVNMNEPWQSLCRHTRDLPGYQIILFGEEGYVNPTNMLGKLPRFGYRPITQLDLGRVQGTPAAQEAAQQLREGGESATTAPCNESMTTTNDSGESKIDTLMWVIYNIPYNKPAEHLLSELSTPVDWV
jgi:hypothetical protein